MIEIMRDIVNPKLILNISSKKKRRQILKKIRILIKFIKLPTKFK